MLTYPYAKYKNKIQEIEDKRAICLPEVREAIAV